MDLYYSPVVEDDGAPAGVIAIVIETTERVVAERRQAAAETDLRQLTRHLEERIAEAIAERAEVEEQLRQSQKMEAIGALTGGVAHDFNNILQIISGNLQLLGMQERQNPKVQNRIETALAAVDRGAKLSSQLLAFARRQPLMPAAVNPQRIFDDLTALLERAVGENVTVELQRAAQPWLIHVDRNRLENAVLNLAINSRDAMNAEGTLRVVAENVALNEADLVGAEVGPGDYVRISVHDTGPGMTFSTLLTQLRLRVF